MEFNEIPYLKVAYDFLCAPNKKFVSSHIHDRESLIFLLTGCPKSFKNTSSRYLIFFVLPATIALLFGPPELFTGKGQEKVWKTPVNST